MRNNGLSILSLLFLCSACVSADEESNPQRITSTSICSSPSIIKTIQPADVYDLSGYQGLAGGSAYALFDEVERVDPKRKIGNPSTDPHPKLDAANYFPKGKGSRIVVDLRARHYVKQIYVYDRSTASDSVWIYTGTMQSWKQKTVIATSGTAELWGWKSVSIEDSTRFLMIRFDSYESVITELVPYGCAMENGLTNGTPTVVANRYTSNSVSEFLGVNSYDALPLKYLAPFSDIRMYCFMSAVDPDTIHSFPNNKYTPDQFYVGNKNANRELFAKKVVESGKRLWYTVMGCALYLEKMGYGNHDRPVDRPGLDPEIPESYSRHAAAFWSLANFYGSSRQKSQSNNQSSGHALMNRFENGNEPDAFWVGSKYSNPMEYFAMSSADYDGHEGRLGKALGLRTADSSAKLLMAGMATLDTNRLRLLKFLCDELRTDKRFIWEGGIQYHHYSHNGKARYNAKRFGEATAGISPEEDSLRSRLQKVWQATRRIQPGVPVILGEYGFDKSRKSKVSVPIVPGFNQSQSQGIMLLRAINQVAFSGFDQMLIYWIKDVEDENFALTYHTSGLIRQHKDGSYTAYPAWYHISAFVHHLGNFIPDEVIQERGKVWVYRYRHKTDSNKLAYFIYSPTRNGTVVKDFKLPIKTVGKFKLVEFSDNDEQGKFTTVTSNGGQIILNIGEKPVLLLTE